MTWERREEVKQGRDKAGVAWNRRMNSSNTQKGRITCGRRRAGEHKEEIEIRNTVLVEEKMKPGRDKVG